MTCLVSISWKKVNASLHLKPKMIALHDLVFVMLNPTKRTFVWSYTLHFYIPLGDSMRRLSLVLQLGTSVYFSRWLEYYACPRWRRSLFQWISSEQRRRRVGASYGTVRNTRSVSILSHKIWRQHLPVLTKALDSIWMLIFRWLEPSFTKSQTKVVAGSCDMYLISKSLLGMLGPFWG